MADVYKKISEYNELAELDASGKMLVAQSDETYSVGADTMADFVKGRITMDATPTQGSSNPVTSNGVYNAVSAVQTETQSAIQTVQSEVGALEVATTPDTTLTIQGAAADAKAAGDAIEEVKDDVTQFSEPNKNLWSGETSIAVTRSKTIVLNEPLPAGTYTFSALVTSTDTDVTTCRIQIKPSNNYIDFSRGYRRAITITETQAITSLVFFAARNTSTSSGDEATFENFQIEAGAIATPYAQHGLTAIDDVARGKIESVKYVAAGASLTNDGNTPEKPYRFLQQAFEAGATTIFVAPGEYTENFTTIYQKYEGKSVAIISTGATFATNIQLRLINANVNIKGININVISGASTSQSGFYLENCTGILENCSVSNATSSGFRLDSCNLTLFNCEAANNAIDGFSAHRISGSAECCITLVNCKAHDNGDDGASVHENGKQYVIGGEYYNNTNCGLAPHNFCYFEIFSAHCHNNRIGVEAVQDTIAEGQIPASGKIIGCICNNNSAYGIDTMNYNVSTLANGFANNGANTHTGTGATIISYSAS